MLLTIMPMEFGELISSSVSLSPECGFRVSSLARRRGVCGGRTDYALHPKQVVSHPAEFVMQSNHRAKCLPRVVSVFLACLSTEPHTPLMFFVRAES
jgi:hypothetical protein